MKHSLKILSNGTGSGSSVWPLSSLERSPVSHINTAGDSEIFMDEQDFESFLKEQAFELWSQDVWESPIEQKMGVALAFMATLPEFSPIVLLKNEQTIEQIEERAVAITKRDNSAVVVIFVQKKIGKYRVDFLIVAAHPDDNFVHKIVVECDGHDFHEKTKEQARRDKQRDRNLTKMGLRVLRFTGSEIYKDPFLCATEALSHIAEYRHGTNPLH